MFLLFKFLFGMTLLRDWIANRLAPTVMEGSICEWNSRFLAENGDKPLQVHIMGDCTYAVTNKGLYRRFQNQFRLQQAPEKSIGYTSGIRDGLSYINLTIPQVEEIDYLHIYCMTKGNRVVFSVAKRSLEKQLTGFRNELSAISPNSRSTSRRQAKRAQNLKLRISTLDALQRNEAVNRDVCTMSDTVMLKWVVESMPEASQGFSCTNSDGQLKGNYTVTNVDSSEKLVEITFTANRRDKVVDVYNCNLGGEAESSTVIHWLDA